MFLFLDFIDGRPYAVSSSPLSFEPVRLTTYWPVEMPEGHTFAPHTPLRETHVRGAYRARTEDGYTVPVYLDPAQKSERTEEEPIPAPRTSRPTRYEYGEWQKHTARGWVSA